MTDITPIGPDELFAMRVLREADALHQRGHHAQLSDLHLRHVATYDQGMAAQWAQRRDAALERARLPVPPPAPAPPAAPAVSQAFLRKAFDAYSAVMIDLLKDALGQRDERIAALEHQLQALEAPRRPLEAAGAPMLGSPHVQ